MTRRLVFVSAACAMLMPAHATLAQSADEASASGAVQSEETAAVPVVPANKATIAPMSLGGTTGKCETSFAPYIEASYYGICYSMVYDCDHKTPYQNFEFVDFTRADCEGTATSCSELHDKICSGATVPAESAPVDAAPAASAGAEPAAEQAPNPAPASKQTLNPRTQKERKIRRRDQ